MRQFGRFFDVGGETRRELVGEKEREIKIVHYHIAASGWIITCNRIQYMLHEIQ